MKLREIFRYELGYRFRSGATWAYFGMLLFVGFWMFLATADGAEAANAPARVAGGGLIIGMFGLMVTAALFADAALRDIEAGMDPLIYTAPISRADYVWGRYLGALVVNAVVFIAIPIAILLATRFAMSTGAETVGAFHLRSHVEPFLTFTLPNLVLSSAILFTIAMLTRQVVPVYLTAIGIFIGTIVLLNYSAGIESQAMRTLLDPFGVASMMHMTELWTESEQNTRMVGLPAVLAVNRALWLAVAAGVLTLLAVRFRFAHASEGGRRARRVRVDAAAPSAERAWPVNVPRVAGVFGWRTTLRQTLAIARASLGQTVASRWFLAVLAACTGLTMLWGWNVGSTVFDTSTWPITMLVVEEALSARNNPLLYLLVTLYAGELVWKERAAGTGQIADAAPVSEAAALSGRYLALAAMLVMFCAAIMLGGILIQALQGYYNFELGLYLRVVFGMRLVEFLILAALAMTVHVVVNHKYVGHMLTIVAFVMPSALYGMRVVRHNLLLYGRDPGWTYSDMNGFGPYAEPFAWFKLYWLAWGLLLLTVAVLLWVRGHEAGMRGRLRQARERFTGAVARTAAGAVALILLFGGFIYYNTNVLNEYVPVSRAGAEQAVYEQRYGRYEDLAQPTIVDARLRIEIFPEQPGVELRGSYGLVNRSGAAIDSVHVLIDDDVDVRALSFDRASEAVVTDEEIGYRIYALREPLAPGDSMRLEFDLSYRARGFPNSGIPTGVARNGTYFHRTMMPFIGYQPMLELASAEARARHDLAPRPPMAQPDDSAALRQGETAGRWGPRDADLVSIDAIIGTSRDQIASTPGVLRRSWTENGRNYFHYRTETPVAFGGTVVSARYHVVEDSWTNGGDSVGLGVFHHPEHEENVDRLMAGMKAALEYLSTEFGPYPYSDLRIVEVPRYEGFGAAHPHMIRFTEDVFFNRVREGEVDQPFYGAAHEVAHAWWGGMVRGAPVRGAAFLSESLANYSAMMITERTYGAEAGRAVYDFQMGRYLLGRAQQGREVPVLQVEDQPYLAYRKGAIALVTLRDRIGEDAVNAAIRRYFERFNRPGPPYPTSLDLYAELRAVTPDSLQPMLVDWFETVTLWDVDTQEATAVQGASGDWIVTLVVDAKKLRADEDGDESEVPLDEWMDVAVFAAVDGGDDQAAPLYTGRHRIRSGVQTMRVRVPERPALAGVDPRGRLIERYREDNVIGVTIE